MTLPFEPISSKIGDYYTKSLIKIKSMKCNLKYDFPCAALVASTWEKIISHHQQKKKQY
jgi:hypothetical protein